MIKKSLILLAVLVGIGVALLQGGVAVAIWPDGGLPDGAYCIVPPHECE